MFGNEKYKLLKELYDSEKERRQELNDRISSLEEVLMEIQKHDQKYRENITEILRNHKSVIDDHTKILNKNNKNPFEGETTSEEVH